MMIKQTKGYVLLTLLVVTGLASQVSRNTLSGKERKALVIQLKDSKTKLLASVSGLSDKQCNYKTSLHTVTIQHCLQQLALAEAAMENKVSATLIERPDTQATEKITDASWEKIKTSEAQMAALVTPADNTTNLTASQSIHLFTKSCNHLITYVNTTTEDVRSHTLQTAAGHADMYQLLQALCTATLFYQHQIEKIKSAPHFPKD